MSEKAPTIEEVYGLNPRQAKFCMEYMIDLNASKAAVRAGYSEDRGKQTGSELLANPAVAQCIDDLKEKSAQRTQVTMDKVIEELAKIAFMDVKSILHSANEHGMSMKALEDIDGHLVSSMEEHKTKDGIVSVKFRTYDKIRALENLRDHLTKKDVNPGINLNLTPEDLKKKDGADIIKDYQQFVATAQK